MGTGLEDGGYSQGRQVTVLLFMLPLMHSFAVARMEKQTEFSDVSLLSFDLQTVEFEYAPVKLFHG